MDLKISQAEDKTVQNGCRYLVYDGNTLWSWIKNREAAAP